MDHITIYYDENTGLYVAVGTSEEIGTISVKEPSQQRAWDELWGIYSLKTM